MANEDINNSSHDPYATLSLLDQSGSDYEDDYVSAEDMHLPASPRKRRRRTYSFADAVEQAPSQHSAAASRTYDSLSERPSTDPVTGPADNLTEIGLDELQADHASQISTLEDIGRLVSSTQAPTVAAIYRLDTSKIDSTCYECIPLACFCPHSDTATTQSSPRYFDLNLNPPSWPHQVSSDERWRSQRPQKHAVGRQYSGMTTAASHASSLAQRRISHPCSPTADLFDSGPVKWCPIDPQQIPVEVFELIAHHLSLSDVKSMRLVNRAFERGVSGHLFENVVVPFNTEIYGALASGLRPTDKISECKGKGRRTDTSHTDQMTLSAALKQQKQSLDVFRGFGSHIRRFGISFAVSDQDLSTALPKEILGRNRTYWGDFTWPLASYPRFEDRAGLELTADETSIMRYAFCHLDNVKHLSLSMDSGLGWLSGPDLSLRSQILGAPTHPFGKYKSTIEPDLQKRRTFWSTLEGAYEAAHDKPALKMAELVRYEKMNVAETLGQTLSGDAVKLSRGVIQGAAQDTVRLAAGSLKHRHYLERLLHETEPRLPTAIRSAITDLSRGTLPAENLRHSITPAPVGHTRRSYRDPAASSPGRRTITPTSEEPNRVAMDAPRDRKVGIPPCDDDHGNPQCGILYTRPMRSDNVGTEAKGNDLIPAHLSQPQREWLMETAWAQDAFLSSYMISVADNSESLGSVRTLTLSPFSSCHLTKLLRADFWQSLSGLANLELLVLPDWRRIERHPAGFTSTSNLIPSKTLDLFYHVLESMVATSQGIKNVTLGWAAGGEHAEGMNARNRLLMPAPITNRQSALLPNDMDLPTLNMPHIERLTLVNCWVAPNVLQDWIRRQLSHRLQSIMLESVSLTAHPRIPNHGGAGVFPGGGPVAAAAAAAPVPGVQQPAGGNLFTQMIQQFQQHMQQAQANHPAGALRLPTVAQMQAQLQQLAQNAAHVNGGNAQNQLNTHAGAAAVPAGQQQTQQREGSWPMVLSRLKSWSSLFQKDLSVTFASCGYALLPRTNFDQSEIEVAVLFDAIQDRQAHAWFTKRRAVVHECLMQTTDSMLGRVASWLPATDTSLLEIVWNLRPGWPTYDILAHGYNDEDGWGKWGWRNQEAAEYDGERPGGSGRFSGVIVFSPRPQSDE